MKKIFYRISFILLLPVLIACIVIDSFTCVIQWVLTGRPTNLSNLIGRILHTLILKFTK